MFCMMNNTQNFKIMNLNTVSKYTTGASLAFTIITITHIKNKNPHTRT